ncbi:MAG TPA: OsmC family protein [Capillimicrobium sp.]|jgi:osmotically inducible protein OsmC
MAARGSAQWRGDLKSGDGDLTVGDGVWSGPYSFKSRFEDGSGTNPEQLLAASHAACFSMALSAQLTEAGTPPTSISTDARVQLRNVDGLPTITAIALKTVGEVPGLDAAGFAEQAQKAKAGCVISRAVTGVGEITLEAELREG